MKRTDIGSDRDPNPDKDRQYQQPELTSERIPGRSFAGENIAAAERQQAETRNSGPDDRGNRTDDVQLSDRTDPADGERGDESGAMQSDTARRANSARTGLDAERRAETDENL